MTGAIRQEAPSQLPQTLTDLVRILARKAARDDVAARQIGEAAQ